MSVADAVEEGLAAAHDAVSARDLDAADRTLARAEARLRAHPELPNASWLMAEVERGWTSVWSLPNGDRERAAFGWIRAESLDGGRAPGVGERPAGHLATMRTSILLEGEDAASQTSPARPRAAELRVDGEARVPGELVLSAGEHQVTVSRDATLVWAEWVSIAEGATILIRAPAAAPCSTGDVAKATLSPGGVGARGVVCPRWVAASALAGKKGLLVATCEGGHCGELLEWRIGLPTAGFAPASAEAGSHRSDWRAWALVGATALIGTAGVLVAAGAFRGSPSSTEFVSGGLRTHAFSLFRPAAGE